MLIDTDKIIEKNLIYYDYEGNKMVLWKDLISCRLRISRKLRQQIKEEENERFIRKIVHNNR